MKQEKITQTNINVEEIIKPNKNNSISKNKFILM